MFKLDLFLGIHIDVELKTALSLANPHLVALFLTGGDYLSELSHENQHYIGKPLPPSPTLSQLESIEIHLLSMIKKLAPHYPFHLPTLIAYDSLRHP